jgi:CarD family transcriptional regulator
MFTKGDKVVHPGHGAAVIECLVEREVSGEIRSYFKLCLAHGLTVMLPVETAAEIGLRVVASRSEIDALFELLREAEGPMPETWSRRHRQNVGKVMSGDLYLAGEVIRDLSLMERRAHLSFQEKRLLVKAREDLISELILSLDATKEHAEAALDAALAGSR